MFCRHCGKEMPEGARFCPACGRDSAEGSPGEAQGQNARQEYGQYGAGAPQQGYPPYPPYSPYPPYPNPQDIYSGGWIALGFFFPLIGLILFLVWQSEMPNRAKACGKGALIGFCVSVGISILAVILAFIMVGIAAATVPYYAAAGALAAV